MKFAICIFLVLSLPAIAQEKKLEIEFKSPKSAMGMYDTYSFVNKERDRVCILAIGSTVIRGYILNENHVLLKEFSGDKPPVNQVLVGGFFSGDKVHYLLGKDEDDDRISYYTYDPAKDLNHYVEINLEIKKSMFMGGLSLGDQFLFINVKKKEDKITVYRFGKKESYEILEFSYPASAIARESLYMAFSKEYGFSRASEVSYINDWESPPISKVKNYCKMYYRNDSLIITIDREIDKIHILGLDLKTQKTSGRLIQRNFDLCGMGFQSSSFLLNEHLYSVVCCNEGLQLSVYDFYSGINIKQYRTEKDEEISFRSTDILQEGSAYFSEEERKLEKTKQLLRKMTNGRAVVIAKNTEPEAVELTIGSYKEMRSGGGGGMWMHGAGPGAAPVYMPTGGFSREWTKSARFKTLLHIQDFEKTGGEIEKPLEERIEAFTKNIKIPEGCEGVYPTNNKLVYYYLDRKMGKLVIAPL